MLNPKLQDKCFEDMLSEISFVMIKHCFVDSLIQTNTRTIPELSAIFKNILKILYNINDI